MTHSIEITAIDDQIPLLLQTKKDEIEEGRIVDHLTEIKETNGQDPLESQTNKFVNQIFDERFENLDKYSSIQSTTIFKVTVGLRESNPDAYKPKLISIGPYHKHNHELGSMEKYKLQYLQRFLKRKGGADVGSCISETDKLKDDALKCYDDIGDLDYNILVKFSEMLLLDGCFVVEYIRERCGMKPEGEDKIIKTSCIANQVCRDLLLLENQLPFFILTKLHDMTQEVEISFTKLVMLYLVRKPNMTHASFLETEGNEKSIKHLLHVVHMSCQTSKMKTSLTENPSMAAENSSKGLCGIPLRIIRTKDTPSNKDHIAWYKVMPNATELSEAGVSFKNVGCTYTWLDENWLDENNSGDSTSLFDIKFENGSMKIPCFEVFDETESLLRNLIAYEQQSYDVSLAYFSDYIAFMDFLIDSDKDVSLLRQKGIIKNWIGDDKEVASLFNKIGTGVVLSKNFYYKEECRKAVQHCEKPWNRMNANLRHNYFNSPWTGISTVAAIILLLLTLTQTVLSFISTLKKSS